MGEVREWLHPLARFVRPLEPINVPAVRCRAASREQASHRILIVRTIAHGDLLMASPLVAALRAAWPDAHITWLVDAGGRESVDASPHLDEVLLWNAKGWKRLTRTGLYPAFWWLAGRLRRHLRSVRPFDVLISLQPEDWGWLVGVVRAPVSIGIFDTFREYHRQAETSPRARLYTHTYKKEDLPPHRVDQYLLPLRALGLNEPQDRRMTLGWTAADEDAARRFVAAHGLTGRPLVAIAPCAGWPSREWPRDRFAALTDALVERHPDVRVVLIGGSGDRPALDAVSQAMRKAPVVSAGDLGHRAMAALLAQAALVVSGETGPMHVAAAVGTPFVALVGPTPVERFVPRVGARGLALAHAVPCGPCHQRVCEKTGDEHQRCLRLISVDEALAAAAAQLERFDPGRPIRRPAGARQSSPV